MFGKTLAAVLVPAAALLAAGQTVAQESHVVIYGVLDSMVRYTTNEVRSDGTSVGNKLQLGEGGALQGSRLGFKGQEVLDDLTSAVFNLEMGFKSDSGAADQQGQIFGRQASVGLKNKNWGEIDFGRQYGVAFDVLGNYDPMGMGNMPENQWQLFLSGVRFDNTIKYSNTMGAVGIEVQYSAGGSADSTRFGTTSGLGLTYTSGPASAGVFAQQSFDTDANKLKVLGIGGAYLIDATTFYLNYFDARRDPGFEKSANNSSGALANTSLLGNKNNLLQRADRVVTAGLQYKATPVITYTVGYMTDWVSNETSFGNNGQISTVYGLVNYAFSKRTDVYFGLDMTKVSGGEIDQGSQTNTLLQFAGVPLLGQTSRTGVGVGIRHHF